MPVRPEVGDRVAVLHLTAPVAQDEGQEPAQRQVVDVDHSAQGPGDARRAVAQCAARLGLEDTADDLLLVVSELVTNAVRHGAPPVRLEVTVDDDAVLVCVADGSCSLPEPHPADDEAEGGRGMTLVELLTSEHGVRRHPPGKTVWASVRRRAAPVGAP